MENRIGKLIVCPTPLGNLGDIPPRALDALRSADVVCCEDTRVTGKLLAALGVEGKRLERMDEATLRAHLHSGRHQVSLADNANLSTQTSDLRVAANLRSLADSTNAGAQTSTASGSVIARVYEGQTVVYCSDAGMPGVSDPGALLVAEARACGIPVEVLPGPTAVTTAYVASGFACPRFYFGGFFPRKEGDRQRTLEMLSSLDAVALFYESPHRIASALYTIAETFPTRQVAVCRELTKLHEEVCIGTARDIANDFAARSDIKGEIVLVIDIATPAEQHVVSQAALDVARQAADELMTSGHLSKKDIVARLQEEFGISRNDAYRMVHRLHAES